MRQYIVLINLILIVIVGLLGFKFYKVVTTSFDIPVQASKKNIGAVEASTVSKKEKKLNEIHYDVIVEKNLFSPSRAPLKKAPKETPSLSSIEKPQLFGTLILNDQKFAILRDPASKTTKRYYVNDKVAGFTVSDILETMVILQRDGETFEIKLRDDKKYKSPKPTRTPPKRRKVRRPRTR